MIGTLENTKSIPILHNFGKGWQCSKVVKAYASNMYSLPKLLKGEPRTWKQYKWDLLAKHSNVSQCKHSFIVTHEGL